VSLATLIFLGLAAGTGAGLLAGLIGIGGGIVVVPVVFYGLVAGGLSADQSAHVAIATSLAAIMPAALVSTLVHWRAGNTDLAFFRDWGPGIAIGVVVAQLAAPHLHGSVLTGLFALFCLSVSIRFAAPNRFRPLCSKPPDRRLCQAAGVGIGLVSGFAGVGGGILTNVVMTVCGLPMHKSIGRAAAAGVLVSIPATVTAMLASGSVSVWGAHIGSINWPIWACIAPSQAVAAWFGAQLAGRVSAEHLSRVFAFALATTGAVMLHSSFGS
jgi:uncharacterized membrane protein YfcA